MNRPILTGLTLLALGALLLGALSPGRLSAATPSLRLVAPAGPLPAGAMIDVAVLASGVDDLGAFEFDLIFDPAVVEVAGVSLAPFFGAEAGCPSAARCAVLLGPVDASANGQGRASVGAFSYGDAAGASGEGVVAVLHLRPSARGGTTALQLAGALLADTRAAAVTPAVTGATLLVEGRPEGALFLPLLHR